MVSGILLEGRFGHFITPQLRSYRVNAVQLFMNRTSEAQQENDRLATLETLVRW